MFGNFIDLLVNNDGLSFIIKDDKLSEFKSMAEEAFTTSNSVTSKEKGNRLEQCICFLIESLKVYEVFRNCRTSTNEIDLYIRYNQLGSFLVSRGLLPDYLSEVLIECKNYKNKVGVTYIGKFYSLMLVSDVNHGIFISNRGVTGNKWNESSGFIKKVYLDSRNGKRNSIYSINSNELCGMNSFSEFFSLLRDKECSLKLDTEIKFEKHENERFFTE